MSNKRPGSDTGHLDFPTETEAHHNEKGMYVMNDPESANLPPDGMVQAESGLYVPAPAEFKHYRLIFTTHAIGTRMEVDETIEEIQELIAVAKSDVSPEWFTFTEPTYGNALVVSRDALRNVIAIGEDFKDMDMLREQQKDYFNAKAMNALNKAVPQNNSQENNRRLIQKIHRGN